MPDWKPEIIRQLVGLQLTPTREAEIVEELSQHIDDRHQELLANGVTEDQAYRLALCGVAGERIADPRTAAGGTPGQR